MTNVEAELLNILRERSFQKGDFILASGEASDHYIDGRMCAVYSKSAYLIGEVLYEQTKSLHLNAIGGLEVGAVPIVTAAVVSYHLHNQTMEGFWVRDKVKEHGTKKRIEGAKIEKGWRVAIVDDVFTQGGSALKAVQAAQAEGAEVVAVIALVDRLRGARELFSSKGIANYQSVFTIRDFGVEPKDPGK